MFAVVLVGGKQYTVSVGDTVVVEQIPGKVGETVTLSNVLLTNDKGVTKVGTPHVPKAKVTAKIVLQQKGEKIDVRRFKSKVRYRRKRGFRPLQTKLEIVAIG
ncbi:50S ribosomal protein L21 [Candidatus Gottesmanbacteria bacterium RBG_13_45_10]|uniref:Large ribosomal subunit protein bL21 n=1 Tax=Candidatus Gottesmanbacteria bacterium RBG_13_45_10 TaxID=1798370 RepID=A0A1F5ZFG8_9BACT|nr:MAG: 50S ribosomal protein L21 [Candidatus Gottesmanbacteria bacterium RBG_13_45_10]